MVLKKFDSGVLHIGLNNPNKFNALTHDMMRELTTIFEKAKNYPDTSVMVLRGEGKSFCSGLDLAHIQDSSPQSRAIYKKEMKLLADLLAAVADCPLPVIAIGQGNIFGVGISLLAAADIAVAFESTKFRFAEVNMGLVPGVITPYIISRMGVTNARRFFLTGEIFHWWDAKEMHLVHYAGTEMACHEFLNSMITHLKKSAPEARRDIKKLMNIFSGHDKKPANLLKYLVDLTATRRFSAEGNEGVEAFLQKREPSWRKPSQRK